MYKIGMHPEVHVAPTVAAASFSDLEDATIVNFEVAYTTGPLSAQAEYCIMTTSSSAMDDPTLTAFYIAANYFLTGEHRTYSKGAFGRLKGPAHNFLDGQAGTGAWQVGIRYSMADLNDKNLVGGELSDITLGVNWYINPNTRVMVDYVHSNIKNKSMSLDDALNAVYFRFAVDF
jgi:phosphate-selective porin OprO/OprP